MDERLRLPGRVLALPAAPPRRARRRHPTRALRGLRPEPRPDRQPARTATASSTLVPLDRQRLAAALVLLGAGRAAAVHGGGVRRGGAVPVLRRPRRPRADRGGARGRAAEFARDGLRRASRSTPSPSPPSRRDGSTRRCAERATMAPVRAAPRADRAAPGGPALAALGPRATSRRRSQRRGAHAARAAPARGRSWRCSMCRPTPTAVAAARSRGRGRLRRVAVLAELLDSAGAPEFGGSGRAARPRGAAGGRARRSARGPSASTQRHGPPGGRAVRVWPGQPPSPRRHLGRRGRQLRPLLRARDRRSSSASSTTPRPASRTRPRVDDARGDRPRLARLPARRPPRRPLRLPGRRALRARAAGTGSTATSCSSTPTRRR